MIQLSDWILTQVCWWASCPRLLRLFSFDCSKTPVDFFLNILKNWFFFFQEIRFKRVKVKLFDLKFNGGIQETSAVNHFLLELLVYIFGWLESVLDDLVGLAVRRCHQLLLHLLSFCSHCFEQLHSFSLLECELNDGLGFLPHLGLTLFQVII